MLVINVDGQATVSTGYMPLGGYLSSFDVERDNASAKTLAAAYRAVRGHSRRTSLLGNASSVKSQRTDLAIGSRGAWFPSVYLHFLLLVPEVLLTDSSTGTRR